MEISTEILLISQVCGSFVFKREREREREREYGRFQDCNTVFMLRRDLQFHLYINCRINFFHFHNHFAYVRPGLCQWNK